MINIIVELSKYFIIMCIGFYTLHGFLVFRYSHEDDRTGFYVMQNIFMILIHAAGFITLAFVKENNIYFFYYAISQVIILGIIALFRTIYPKSDRLIINNMCMLLTTSFIILARLSTAKFLRQFSIMIIGLIIAFFIPYLMRYVKEIALKANYIFGISGLVILLIVLIMGSVTYGSKLSFTIKGVTFQPSELVKIIYVFFIAASLFKSIEKKQLLITTLFALMHIAVLVLSKDLGSALIFFIVYLMMIFVATGKIAFLLTGLIFGVISSVAGYFMFSHVRVRVSAWLNPFMDIDGRGYQISQSLFAMGTGSWFGLGLGQGAPNKIPVVEADFIFSAISEEMGCLYSIFLVLICISTFLMFMNIALKSKDIFNKLSVLGFAIIYGFQMFLTIGGVIKFIPLTGVTLPLVSYGGTSVIVSLMIFSIIQGICITEKKKQHYTKVSEDKYDEY